MSGRRTTALGVWLAAIAAYVLGVFHRSSLAVAGLHATERFALTASQLSYFVVLQLLVYALAQVPVGLLVDRFGPRRVLLGGIVTITAGQVGFALVEAYPWALASRALVGIGDAVTFVCILRLITAWFPDRRIPLMTQVSGPVGQVGAVLATAPTVWALGAFGWERTYLASAAAGLVVLGFVLVVVADEPGRRSRSGTAMSWRGVRTGLRATWVQPGTRLGFWVHFSHHFSASLLALLWGFPFLVVAQGTSEETAGALLSLLVLAVIAAGPLTGWLVSRYPRLRFPHVMLGLGAVVAVWTLVLLWPGAAPPWLLVALVVTVGATGPAAMIGFDFARTTSPPERLGLTSAVVNQGGFLASLVAVVVVGIVLDAASGGSGTRSAAAFDLAMSTQYVLWGLAAVQIVRHHRHWRRATAAAAVPAATGAPDPAPDPAPDTALDPALDTAPGGSHV